MEKHSKKAPQDVLEVLSRSTIKDNNLFLPEQLERELYVKVMKVLENHKGKWSRKLKCHTFPGNPSDYIEGIVENESYVDIKKKYQFFPTPQSVGFDLCDTIGLQDGDNVLEPSAGEGDLLLAIKKYADNKGIKVNLFFCEINPDFRVKLFKEVEAKFICADFFGMTEREMNNWNINKIIANPPFNSNQDVQHINHMYNILPVNGEVVAIVSAGVKFKEIPFYNDHQTLRKPNILHSLKQPDSGYTLGFMDELDSESFKESGTKVNTVKVYLKKLGNSKIEQHPLKAIHSDAGVKKLLRESLTPEAYNRLIPNRDDFNYRYKEGEKIATNTGVIEQLGFDWV